MAKEKKKHTKKIIIISAIVVVLIIIVALILGFINIMLGSATDQLQSMSGDMSKTMNYMAYTEQIMPTPLVPPNGEPYDTTFFENYGVNPFISTEDEVYSTFGMDVDTASYTVARRWITDGNIPDKDSVRTEEFINYFEQDYPNPEVKFGLYVEGAKSAFGEPNYHLMKIGVKAKEVSLSDRKPANMVFLVDVSGSMNREDRLELVKKSLEKLAKNLKDGDKVGLAVYAGGGGKILDLTHDKNKIINALSELKGGGSTNLDEGLTIAYDMARDNFEEGKINRIIIASDGVANVGRTDADTLLEQIKTDADKGITLTTLGFGMGNYNDVMMEKLANHGDGNYYYIDSEEEADRLFQGGATSLLQIIGLDAKIQVEFNPDTVDRFRLLGYENRRLETEDFEDDSIDAGEVGAGQTVTALYELRIKDDAGKSADLATVRIRYQDIDTKEIETLEQDVTVGDIDKLFSKASDRFRFTAGVAEFAELLKESYWAKDSSFESVLEVVEPVAADEKDDEFVDLVKKVIRLE
jgi:Ca-activated chloride channel homolog